MTALVVGGDSNVDVLGWGVGVGESNDGDVDVAGLLDGLRIGAGVGNDDQAGLTERAGDVVGEVTGSEATSNGDSASVSSELEDGALTVRAGRDDTDIRGVVNRGDDTGSEDNLLPLRLSDYDSSFFSCSCIPGLANVDHVDSIWASLPEVWLHVDLEVLGPKVALSCKKHLNVLRGRIEDRGEVVRGHLDDCCSASCGVVRKWWVVF